MNDETMDTTETDYDSRENMFNDNTTMEEMHRQAWIDAQIEMWEWDEYKLQETPYNDDEEKAWLAAHTNMWEWTKNGLQKTSRGIKRKADTSQSEVPEKKMKYDI